jgi:hypothetical protein
MNLKQLLQSRITKRYVLLTFMVVFGSLASIYYVTTNVLHDSVNAEIKYRNQLMGQTISTKTSFMLEKMINDIRIISEFALSDSKENTHFYYAEMDHVVSKNPLYLFLDVIDESRTSIATIPNVNFSSNDEIHDILDRLEWSKTFYKQDVLYYESLNP